MIYHGMCGVHQTECTSPPIEVMLLDLSKYSLSEWLELFWKPKVLG